MMFKLPDDFEGDLNDALEEILKYRRNPNKGHSGVFIANQDKSVYENWWDMVSTTDRVLYGNIWIGEHYDDKPSFIKQD